MLVPHRLQVVNGRAEVCSVASVWGAAACRMLACWFRGGRMERIIGRRSKATTASSAASGTRFWIRRAERVSFQAHRTHLCSCLMRTTNRFICVKGTRSGWVRVATDGGHVRGRSMYGQTSLLRHSRCCSGRQRQGVLQAARATGRRCERRGTAVLV